MKVHAMPSRLYSWNHRMDSRNHEYANNLLLEHEHVVVEELLQALVHEVDPQLLERVELEGRLL